MMLGGMRVIEVALRIGPARVHSKRRGGKASYHRRVQKKWTKRFGMVDSTPVKRGEIMQFRDTLLVRIDDMPKLKELLRDPNNQNPASAVL